MKITYKLVLGMLLLTLSSCTWFEPNPYANFSVGEVNEDGPDTDAVILVGDPQVISRETLINDRIRESKHIGTLIDDSVYETFEPQILRDIKVVNAFTSQLGVGFDPSLGRAFKRSEDIASLSTEMELLKLKNQLKQLKEQIKTDPADIDLNPKTGELIVDPRGKLSTTAEKDPNLVIDHKALTGNEGSLVKLLNAVETVLKKGTDTAQSKANESQLKSSPEERFEDLNAYRARLRQRQAEINLDDVHDLLGNTLYRLQLDATILPGEIKNKYGVLDFAISGSKVKENELDRVYTNWLVSLYNRTELINNLDDKNFNNKSIKLSWNNIISSFTKNGLIEPCKFNVDSKDKIMFLPPAKAAEGLVKAISGKNINSDVISQVFMGFSNKETINNLLPSSLESLLPSLSNNIKECKNISGENPTPKAFKDKLTLMEGNVLLWKANNVYTYQAQPSEKVQRLSTLASAANSMQSAFALAATLPQYGITIDAGAAASKVAVGMVDAIERSPLVIGYTDKKKDVPHFGYIFGPKAILQTDDNQLVYKQVPARHSVFADISVPGWWPALTLKTRKAWVGNWHNGSNALKSYNKTHEINVRLRPKRQGFEALTDYLYSNAIPSATTDIASIEKIFPENIDKCAKGIVNFIFKGKNLWRNPKVFILGVQQDPVTVLPDMEGISVKVDLRGLPMNTWYFRQEDESVIVWTSFGKARLKASASLPNFGGSIKDCPKTTEKLQLLPDKNFYTGGPVAPSKNNITLTVTSKIPDAIRNYKIIAQVISNQRANKVLVSSSTSREHTDKSQFKGKIILNKGLLGNLSPALLRVGLRYQLVEGEAVRESAGSRYFCESLFWASQPKQAAKT